MRFQHKKLIFFVALIVFLIGGFFIYAHSAKAVDPAPAAPATAPATSATAPTTNTETIGNLPGELQQDSSPSKAPAQKDLYFPIIGQIVGILLYFILTILSHLVAFAANLSDLILSINKFTTVSVVQYGWEITRGLCNMIFALVLLMLAFDTVLQTEYMGTKRTLVRLIVITLLINFSLMFGGIIIDFCQVLTFYFIKAAAGDTNSYDVSLKLAGGMNLSKLWETIPVADWKDIILHPMGPGLAQIVTMLMCCVILLVTVFTFFAFSFFLLVRVVWLWLLLILAPLAWASYVAPPDLTSSFGGGFQTWWKEFLKWSFFAPAYAFFLYLAMTLAQTKLTVDIPLKNTVIGDKYLLSDFFQNLDLVLQYIVIVMILLAGLKAAKSAGVYGASAVMSTVSKMGNTVGDWGKRQTKRPFYAAYDKSYAGAASLLGKGISKIGFKNAGNILAAKSRQIKTAAGDREHNKAFRNLLPHLSREAVLGLLANASGTRALDLAKAAKARGDLTKDYGDENDPAQLAKDPNIKKKNDISREAAKKARDTFRSFEMQGEADALEETRLDIVEVKGPDDTEGLQNLKDRLRDGSANGNLAKNKAGSFKGAVGQRNLEVMGQMIEKEDVDRKDFGAAYMKMSTTVQKTLKASANLAIQGDTDYEKMGLRHLYAGVASDINGAFSGPNERENIQKRREYINSLENKEMASFSTKTDAGKASLEEIGKYATEGQYAGVRGELTGIQKTLMMQGALSAGRRNEFDNFPMWSGVIKAIEKAGKQQAGAVAGLGSKMQGSAAVSHQQIQTQSTGPSVAADTDEAAPI